VLEKEEEVEGATNDGGSPKKHDNGVKET